VPWDLIPTNRVSALWLTGIYAGRDFMTSKRFEPKKQATGKKP
jgi:hypothetical protein